MERGQVAGHERGHAAAAAAWRTMDSRRIGIDGGWETVAAWAKAGRVGQGRWERHDRRAKSKGRKWWPATTLAGGGTGGGRLPNKGSAGGVGRQHSERRRGGLRGPLCQEAKTCVGSRARRRRAAFSSKRARRSSGGEGGRVKTGQGRCLGRLAAPLDRRQCLATPVGDSGGTLGRARGALPLASARLAGVGADWSKALPG